MTELSLPCTRAGEWRKLIRWDQSRKFEAIIKMGNLGKVEIPNFEVHKLQDFTLLYNSLRQAIYLASDRAETRP